VSNSARDILKIIKLIEKQVEKFNIPWVTKVSEKKDPYHVLISCILSLRTKDNTTSVATKRLFKIADTPQKILELSSSYIEKLIYPVGFYRNKAKIILQISRKIIDNFNGKVPDNLEELLELKGVGRKTANLVLGLGYGRPSICVDTHVHRISNRIGWVNTKGAQQTEETLKEIIPKSYWIRLNTLLVAFGQNVCLPISPHCTKCYVNKYCDRIGVNRYR
jgi:endonuclease-3